LRETRHNSVVLIIRQSPFSKSRNIPRSIYEIMRKELDRLVANTNLQVEVFDDKDNVSFADTLKMFHRARLIVGIHGAGLTNMIHSKPGTYVVEMLCQQPETSLGLFMLTSVLGNHYHAVPLTGCQFNATVNVKQLIDVTAMYINILKTAN
jgi:hypothetical protein